MRPQITQITQILGRRLTIQFDRETRLQRAAPPVEDRRTGADAARFAIPHSDESGLVNRAASAPMRRPTAAAARSYL
jgi:hypothetical protein